MSQETPMSKREKRIFSRGLPTTRELHGTNRTYQSDPPAYEGVLFDFPWLLGALPYWPNNSQGAEYLSIRVCEPDDPEIQVFLKSSGSIHCGRGGVALFLATRFGWQLNTGPARMSSDEVRPGLKSWGEEIQRRGAIAEGYNDLLAFAVLEDHSFGMMDYRCLVCRPPKGRHSLNYVLPYYQKKGSR